MIKTILTVSASVLGGFSTVAIAQNAAPAATTTPQTQSTQPTPNSNTPTNAAPSHGYTGQPPMPFMTLHDHTGQRNPTFNGSGNNANQNQNPSSPSKK